MDKAHYILIAALLLCLYFLFKPNPPVNTFEQELKAARDSLSVSLAIQDSIIAQSRIRQDSIKADNQRLLKEKRQISIAHEKARHHITTATDTQLVRIIAVQNPPAGY